MKKYLQKSQFSYSELLLMAMIMFLGLFLRWYLLDQRAIHHDESLHGMYGKYSWIDPARKFYKYNPLLHGPLLYNFLPWVYDILGASKFSIRAVSAAIGSLLIFIPFAFKRYFSKTSILILVTYISLSPSLIYWSRYIRHDSFVLLFMFAMLFGFTIKERFRALVILPAFSLQLCTKENSFITLALLLGYLIYDWSLNRIIQHQSICHRLIKYIKLYYKEILIGVVIASFIYIYFYSSGFRYSYGILDGLYRKSIVYWLNQHAIERIKGPFSFQLLVLSWYELFFVIATIVHLVHFYIKRSWAYKAPIIVAVITSCLLHLIFKDSTLAKNAFWSIFKLKINLDFYPLIILPVHAIIITTHYIKERNFALSFWGYLYFATFFTYSFVGEKVPWLAVYPLLTGLIFLTLYFQQYSLFKQREHQLFSTAVATLCFTFIFKLSVLTNFTNVGNPNELINQVHTTSEFEQKIIAIQNQIVINKKRFFCHNVAIWPTSWFLYGLPGYSYGKQAKDESSYDYLIGKRSDYSMMLRLKKTHNIQSLSFRSWWVPQYRQLSWLNFFKYALTHQPWNPSGSLKVTLFSKKKEKLIFQ